MIRSRAGKRIHWTERDITFLKENFASTTARELAGALRLRSTAVRGKCYQMGLRKFEVEYWTTPQVKFLRKNYRRIGDVEIAEIFQRRFPKNKKWTEKHIRKKRCYLNLLRSERMVAAIKKRNIIQGRYSVSHWKRWFGKSAPVGETRMWKISDGSARMFVRLKEGWVPYARFLYQQTFGPVPKGFVVKLKDGNPYNVVVENLEAVSFREACGRLIHSDRFIASRIARSGIGQGGGRVDRELQIELLKHPELIHLKRQQIILERTVKGVSQ